MPRATTALALILALDASASTTSASVYQGAEPQLIHRTTALGQGRLQRGAAWRAFTAGEGAGWQATFDERTGTPRALWGRGIPMPTGSRPELGAAVGAFLERHHDLLGFAAGGASLRHLDHSPEADTWYLDFDVPIDGVLAYRSGISARVKKGRLIYLSATTWRGVPTVGEWLIGPEEAGARAIAQGPHPDARHLPEDCTSPIDRLAECAPALRRWLPRNGDSGLELRAVWMVRSRTSDPPGRWVSFVDAESGELLHVYNEIPFLRGTVMGEHEPRTVDGSPLITSPIPLITVRGDFEQSRTAEDGSYTMEPSGLYETDLASSFYVSVSNASGPPGALASTDPDLLWTTESATQAEISTFVFLNDMRRWGERLAPTNRFVAGHFTSSVNDTTGTCNAYWFGEGVMFHKEGGGCNNTARIADINYHEWGHGFHGNQIRTGYFDGSLGEGAADCASFFNTGDPLIGPYFFYDGSGIREVESDLRYPADIIDGYTHHNGLIFAGSIWDLWKLLKERLGDAEGTLVTEQIFADLLIAGPDIPNSFNEAMVADDDDGDLSNGTPHECSIIEAFGIHGLGPVGDGQIATLFHEPIVSAEPGQEIPITATFTTEVPRCFDIEGAGGGTLYYRRVGDEKWTEVAMANAGEDDLESVIPPQEEGTFLEYAIEVSGGEERVLRSPTVGTVAPYSFYVGPTIELWCHDFERNDAGFKHKLVKGTEEGAEEADDWHWGTPEGKSTDPSVAHSGSLVWGNDLGTGSSDGSYRADLKNRLRSRTIALEHYEGVFLSYWRWLNVEDGSADQASIEVNGAEVWSNHASDPESAGNEHHLDDQWMQHVVPLAPSLEEGAIEVEVDWVLDSDQDAIFGGWNLDDVCFLAPMTPNNRLAVTDFTANRKADGTVELAWTNPQYEPLESVVVVRNAERLPEGPADGVPILYRKAAEIGAAESGVDPMATDQEAWYAVYPSDGTSHLGWTVEGWNAAHAAGLFRGGQPPGPREDGGCGCATGSSAAGGVELTLLAVAALLRRRSRRASGA